MDDQPDGADQPGADDNAPHQADAAAAATSAASGSNAAPPEVLSRTERVKALLDALDRIPADQVVLRAQMQRMIVAEMESPATTSATAPTQLRWADIAKLCSTAAGAAAATKDELRLPTELWTRVNQHIALALGALSTEAHRMRSFMMWLDSKDQCEELKTAYLTWKQLHVDLVTQIAAGTADYTLEQLQKGLELHVHGTTMSTGQLLVELCQKPVPASFSAFASYVARFKSLFAEYWTKSLSKNEKDKGEEGKKRMACSLFYEQIARQQKVFDALKILIVTLSQTSVYKNPQLVDIYDEETVEKLCSELRAVEDRERQAKKDAVSAPTTTSSASKQEKRRLDQHGGIDSGPRHKKNGGGRDKDGSNRHHGKRVRDGPPPDNSGWCTYIERDSAGAVLRDHSQFAHLNAECSKQRSTYSPAAPAAATSASNPAPPPPPPSASAPYFRGVGALGPRLPKK